MMERKPLLVIGYGNPGRLDDGLGPAFAERIKSRDIAGLDTDSNYQLNVEDAAVIAEYDTVVFADASVDATEPFEFYPLEKEEPMVGFSSHSISTGSVLGLAEELFGVAPSAYMLAIRGYEYNEFGERLSLRGEENLSAAVDFFVKWAEGLSAYSASAAQCSISGSK